MKRRLFTSRADAVCCIAVYLCTAVMAFMVIAPVYFGEALAELAARIVPLVVR